MTPNELKKLITDIDDDLRIVCEEYEDFTKGAQDGHDLELNWKKLQDYLWKTLDKPPDL